MNDESTYKTSDLYLTAYLKIKGHRFAVEKSAKKSTEPIRLHTESLLKADYQLF